MTTTHPTVMNDWYLIFKAEDGFTDAAFTIEELRDIVNHGMSAGVPMFIYTKDNVAWFDENDDEIQDYLSDWVHDNIGGEESSFSYFAKGVEDIRQLKEKLVWAYVELKAHEILCSVDPNY